MSCPQCEPRPGRSAQLWEPCEVCGHEPIYINVEEKLEKYGLLLPRPAVAPRTKPCPRCETYCYGDCNAH